MKANDVQAKVQMDAYLQHIQQGQFRHDQGRPEAAQQDKGGDRVELSPGSRILQEVKAAPEPSSPERDQRVEQLRANVEEGNFSTNPVQVANAMMNDLIRDLG